jgi:TolB protein
MRLTLSLAAPAAIACLAFVGAAAAQQPPAGDKPPNPEDLLGNIVVVAGAGRPLPKIGVLPSLAPEMEDVTVRSVARRDLELSGEFEVLPDSAAPDGVYLSDTPVDVKAWAAKGVEAVVKVSGRPLAGGKAELRAQAFFVNKGAAPVFDKRFSVPASALRQESHRLTDLVIGALTGQSGGFASHMTFASGGGKLRRVYAIDADGNDPKVVSPPDQQAIAPTFGPGDELWYAGSAGEGAPFLPRIAGGGLVPIGQKGSVYGLAFSRDKKKIALSIGVEDTVKVFVGPEPMSIAPASEIGMAMHPAFSPSGKLAFSGEGKYGQRIYVDGKAASPEGLNASAPVFCNHPDGVKLVYQVGVGKNTDLVSSGETGGGLSRLTQNQGRNSYPACSPDGRLVAFFSTRTGGEGPGLYVMRVDGGRPKRVSSLLGDSLRWDALPPGQAAEIK